MADLNAERVDGQDDFDAMNKNVPRKHCIICPVCKEALKEDEKFEDHLLECSKNRVQCKYCGQTFKKMLYLQKHEQKQHKVDAAQKVDTAQDPQPGTSSTKDNNDDTDWLDNEPDVSIGDESGASDGVGQNVTPADDKDSDGKSLATVRDAVTVKPSSVQRQDVAPDMKPVVVKCSRKDCTDSSQRKVDVSEGGENIYQNTVKMRRANRGPMNVNLGDFLLEGTIRTSDVEMTLYEDGQVELKFPYKSDNQTA